MPTTETPTVVRGNIEGRGKEANWVSDPEGSLIKIIFGSYEKRDGTTNDKFICFGKEKASALLNSMDDIKEFVLE